ncbi:MAG: histidine ammonia-lyase [bacterium]|nr:histidine ammonia-lyase [bacterium]
MNRKLVIDGESLTIRDVVEVARSQAIKVVLSPEAKFKVKKSSDWVREKSTALEPIYGLNTGVGSQENVRITATELKDFQQKIILSHASAVGEPLPHEIVRATLLLRANALAKGYSGVRCEVIETILELLNKGIYPIVPEKGSVGASGDLALLAHIALVLIGKGEADYQGQRMTGIQALNNAGIKPLELEPKEGIALINGSQVSAGIGAIAVWDAQQVFKNSEIASSLSLEALIGFRSPFCQEIHKIRPYPGACKVAQNILNITQGSKWLDTDKKHVQDAYSLRCIPQVLGVILDIIQIVDKQLLIEINSATDNPLVFTELNKVISGGNFHGEPIAVWLDALGIGIANLGNISERRIFRLLTSYLNKGLPSFLTTKPGLNSGFAIAQCTAASLVSENKVLANPASVDSIPTSEGQEDYVSMAPISAKDAREIIKNVEHIVAIELLVATQSIDLRVKLGGLKLQELGKGTLVAYQKIREKVPFLDEDREIYKDIQAVLELVKNNEILTAVENEVGEI